MSSNEFTVASVQSGSISLSVQYLGPSLTGQKLYLLPRSYKLTGTVVPIPGFFGARVKGSPVSGSGCTGNACADPTNDGSMTLRSTENLATGQFVLRPNDVIQLYGN